MTTRTHIQNDREPSEPYPLDCDNFGSFALRLHDYEPFRTTTTRTIDSPNFWIDFRPTLYVLPYVRKIAESTGVGENDLRLSVVIRDRDLNRFEKVFEAPANQLFPGIDLAFAWSKFSKSNRFDIVVLITPAETASADEGFNKARAIVVRTFTIRTAPSVIDTPKHWISSYPSLSVEGAQKALAAYQSNEPIKSIVQKETVSVAGTGFDRTRANDLFTWLRPLKKSSRPGLSFEKEARAIVHKVLDLHPHIAGDPGFWRWLTFSNHGALTRFVDWRYQRRGQRHARDQYFGFGSLKQGMYAYLWFCAQAVHDSTLDDPYELTRKGDVDVWQSHIVRIDFGSVPQMARAFIRFIDRAQLQRQQYRELAREISKQSKLIVFELLKESDCLKLIREFWFQHTNKVSKTKQEDD